MPAALTDTGCERDLNEDRFMLIEKKDGMVWIVCDGMGGVAGGELAAQLAIEAMKREIEPASLKDPEAVLKHAMIEANRIIVLRRQNPSFAQMGTTAVTACVTRDRLSIAHVGDSRAYLIRDGAIEQLTVDHTLVQEMVDEGRINHEEALTHPQAHILTKCLGSEPGLEISMLSLWIWGRKDYEPYDSILLCSDGLYSHVSDEEIAEIVHNRSPRQAVIELVALAKQRGGYDNITVAVIPVDGQLQSEAPQGKSVAPVEEGARRPTIDPKKLLNSVGGGVPHLPWVVIGIIGALVFSVLATSLYFLSSL